MKLGLKDKRALVLGSSRGLGYGIAKQLIAEGASVGICGRDRARLERAKTELASPKLQSFVVDLTLPASVETLAQTVLTNLGDVDILINNCGGPPPGPVSEVTAEEWVSQFNAMAAAIFHLTGKLLPGMRARKWGRILNIASSGVVQPIPNLGISNAVRAAIVGWAKTLAAEVAADGVTVNTILPGRIHTERIDQLDAAAAKRQGISQAQAAEQARTAIPMRRYGKVEEFAAVAVFMVSEPASYVTGSLIRVDGGLIQAV